MGGTLVAAIAVPTTPVVTGNPAVATNPAAVSAIPGVGVFAAQTMDGTSAADEPIVCKILMYSFVSTLTTPLSLSSRLHRNMSIAVLGVTLRRLSM